MGDVIICRQRNCKQPANWVLNKAGIEPGVSVWWLCDIQETDNYGACTYHLSDVLHLLQMEARSPSADRTYEQEMWFIRST